jgi:hypothetical protein
MVLTLALPTTSKGYAGVFVPIPTLELYTLLKLMFEPTPPPAFIPVTDPVTVKLLKVVTPLTLRF